jgi:hypothetical protein
MRPRSTFPGSQLKGRVRVWNDEGFESLGKNLVVYTGGDVLMGLAAGKPNYRIAGFYFEYINTSGSISEPAVVRTDTAATRQAMASPHDLLRAQLAAAPLISALSGLYNGNQATYFSVSSATTGALHSLPFTAVANSHVYAVCLVATPVPGDLTQDILYSRYLLGTPVPVTGSGQVSASWMIEAD